ncbi:HD domain-containing protein [Halomonas elongata]|uniref:HD domain-containing protein n=1 Tax=Halomonas elongata TaxID=2746 RepID=UPI0023AEA816|nr:HD domain-containing protein [Halomonas elongata]
MTDLIMRAAIYSRAAHQAVGQRRKYTGEPYHLHPKAVAKTVESIGGTPEMVAAAYLHDVVEDTHVTFRALVHEFGPTVAGYVFDLTDQFIDPDWGNRAQRKAMERDRLARISAEAQTIKLADLIDNTQSIVERDPGFARVYMAEKRELLKVMRAGDSHLLELAWGVVDTYFGRRDAETHGCVSSAAILDNSRHQGGIFVSGGRDGDSRRSRGALPYQVPTESRDGLLGMDRCAQFARRVRAAQGRQGGSPGSSGIVSDP